MALNGITLMKGATAFTPTGGTGTVFDTDSGQGASGIHVVDMTEANFLLRMHAMYKNKPHALQGDGTFSKGIRNIIFTMPILLASGKISYQVHRTTLEIHPEATTAQINELRRMGGQSYLDSEADNFVFYGSLK